MRLFFLFFSVFIFTFQVLAQQETPQYPSQDYQKSRNLEGVLKYEANTIVRDNDFFGNRFGVAFEKRLKKEVSFNSSLRLYRQSRRFFEANINEKRPAAWQWEMAIEPRWYYLAKDDTARGANFYGDYVGLKFIGEGGYRRSSPVLKTLVTYGLQRFFYTSQFNNSDNHLDASVGIGLAFQKGESVRPAFQILVLQGVVLNSFLPKYRKNNSPPDRNAEYLAQKDDNSMFKFDLFNLVTKADEQDFVGELNLVFEYKLGKSPFSINLQSYFTPHFFKTDPSVKNVQSATTQGNRWGFGIEPRWYYDLNKRRAKGLSGNNLLGYYLSLEFAYQNQTVRRAINSDANAALRTENLTLTPLWGVQQQFSEHVFYDFRCGLGIRTSEDKRLSYFDNYKSVIFADVLLGFAF